MIDNEQEVNTGIRGHTLYNSRQDESMRDTHNIMHLEHILYREPMHLQCFCPRVTSNELLLSWHGLFVVQLFSREGDTLRKHTTLSRATCTVGRYHTVQEHEVKIIRFLCVLVFDTCHSLRGPLSNVHTSPRFTSISRRKLQYILALAMEFHSYQY